MDPALKKIVDNAKSQMDKSIDHLENELHKVRAGRAAPAMLDVVKVDYYGTLTPLNQVGTVSSPDPRTLTVQPYERKMIPVIEKAIKEANLGFNPSNDGVLIRIVVPTLTEDRRKALVKQAKEMVEDAKIAIRKIRQGANDEIKKAQKGGVAEDEARGAEDQVQKSTNQFITKADEQMTRKEAEIMTI